MGNSPMTGEFSAQRASNAENGSIWWRHHGVKWCRILIITMPTEIDCSRVNDWWLSSNILINSMPNKLIAVAKQGKISEIMYLLLVWYSDRPMSISTNGNEYYQTIFNKFETKSNFNWSNGSTGGMTHVTLRKRSFWRFLTLKCDYYLFKVREISWIDLLTHVGFVQGYTHMPRM